LPLQTPPLQQRNFKIEAFLDGKEFLYRNHAEQILFRTGSLPSNKHLASNDCVRQ